MNYYPRHIGDFISATAHLSMVEDGAYNRLLDWYYQDERPLPADRKLIYRRMRALTDFEKEAVDAVLDEFFTLDGDCYRHSRCDAEIARTQEKSSKAKRSAAQRWQIDGNANAMRTHSEGNATRARDQQPIANSQEPIPTEQSSFGREGPSSGESPSLDPAPALEPSAPPASPAVTAKKSRPVRKCPDTFEVTDEMLAWARTECPGVEIGRETSRMRDHEFAIAKSDWTATWRNWMRRAHDNCRRNSGQDDSPYEGKYGETLAGLTGGRAGLKPSARRAMQEAERMTIDIGGEPAEPAPYRLPFEDVR